MRNTSRRVGARWRMVSVALASLITLGTLGASGLAGAATSGGNASGGSFATQANKEPLVGPKGTGLTRGVTASSIKVGCVYTSGNYTGYVSGIQAAFAAANKKGIYGRKLTLVPCLDDTAGVQANLTESQQLVNQDQVFAELNLSAYTETGTTNFLNTNQVPYIGWGFDPGYCGFRWGFGWNGCLESILLPKSDPLHNVVAGNLAEAMIQASGLPANKVRVAIQSDNLPASVAANVAYVNLFDALGSKVVYDEGNIPSTATGVDYTPFVQAIIASNPNIVYLSTPFADVAGLSASLKAAGYKGDIMDFTTYAPGLLASSAQLAQALSGEYINTQIVPQEGGGSWVEAELSALKAIGQPAFLTLGASIGYAEGTELVEMLQAAGKTLNTKTFDQNVNNGKFTSYSNAPSGGPGKLIWPAAHFIPADCAAIVQVSGSNYVVKNSFKCYSSYEVG